MGQQLVSACSLAASLEQACGRRSTARQTRLPRLDVHATQPTRTRWTS